MNAQKPSVVVVGSLNIDYIATVEKLPAPGQTVAATGLVQRFGGKGANQAIASARQGAATAIIGCLGRDSQGDSYVARLAREGVNCAGLFRSGSELTGSALIAVDAAGENMIVVAPGANGALKPQNVRKGGDIIRQAGILLAQFEVPLPSVLEAFRIAHESSVPIVLNPSPLRRDFPWGKFPLDSLLVNEGEAAALLGNLKSERIFPALKRKSIRRLVVTRGARPTLVFSDGATLAVPAHKVRPVDTVGAGDAFAGAYAAWLASGADLGTAVRYANIAGALTTLKHGAQEAMPTRQATMRQSDQNASAPKRFKQYPQQSDYSL